MSAQSDPIGNDTHASAEQWVAWLQELLADRPAARTAIERCLRTLVLDARRHQVQVHLERLDEKDLETVAALVAQLQRHPRDEPT